ncbi:F-box protein SKIP23-like [Chenopodium quinoa]|uniref:KIB1-4 beta-propeller domain-containing protein n=1 Tax=Chenopodium quinoa TaxID=63459 RepID=A0A803LG84_CHEQI|nr:F-box protein SKIP23-like [Chenopodium quinoa]
MADWSELPSELLELISNLSNTCSNTRQFRSVCSYWRSSVRGKPTANFYYSPTIKFLGSKAHDFDLRLIRQTTYIISLLSDPNSCWVIKTEEHKPGVLRLLSPFSKSDSIKPLDHNILDLSNVNTFEIGHEYVLRNISGNDRVMNLYNMEYEKVAFATIGGNDSFVLLSTQNSTGKLLMYRSNTQEWALLDDFALGFDDTSEFVYDMSMRYVDVAEYEGKFYAVTDSGRTVVIEYGGEDEILVEVDLMVKSIIGGNKKYLVKSGDDLLLVDLYTSSDKGSCDVYAIDVFKLDKEDKKWVLLKCLGGHSIFLSNYSSFSTTSTSLHGLKENCIYFFLNNLGRDFSEKKQGNIEDIDGVESGGIGVFNYEMGTFESLEENIENSKFCWPPPSWVNFVK